MSEAGVRSSARVPEQATRGLLSVQCQRSFKLGLESKLEGQAVASSKAGTSVQIRSKFRSPFVEKAVG